MSKILPSLSHLISINRQIIKSKTCSKDMFVKVCHFLFLFLSLSLSNTLLGLLGLLGLIIHRFWLNNNNNKINNSNDNINNNHNNNNKNNSLLSLISEFF